MSTNINANVLNNWIVKHVGTDLTAKEAQKFGIEDEYTELAEELDVSTIDIEDFSDDLLAAFSVVYVTEQDKKAEAKDKEQEKEEQTAIKDKSGAGV